MTGIAEIIEQSRINPPKPIIDGLIYEHEIVGLHGPTEAFKTFLCLHLMESLANGTPFLDTWKVPKPLRVFFFETEMSVDTMGKRLGQMFSNRAIPPGVSFVDESRLHQFRKASGLSTKFCLLSKWIEETKADVFILDTANPCFRGREHPNDETAVGLFFDLLAALPVPTKFFSRHNHRPKRDDDGDDPVNKIRGSGQWGDVPDFLMQMCRWDKRTNQGSFSVSKFRHGTKPDYMVVWFDAQDFRLVTVPPPIFLLKAGPLLRQDLLDSLEKRFDISQRTADSMIQELDTYIMPSMNGHSKKLEIDWTGVGRAEWAARLSGRG